MRDSEKISKFKAGFEYQDQNQRLYSLTILKKKIGKKGIQVLPLIQQPPCEQIVTIKKPPTFIKSQSERIKKDDSQQNKSKNTFEIENNRINREQFEDQCQHPFEMKYIEEDNVKERKEERISEEFRNGVMKISLRKNVWLEVSVKEMKVTVIKSIMTKERKIIRQQVKMNEFQERRVSLLSREELISEIQKGIFDGEERLLGGGACVSKKRPHHLQPKLKHKIDAKSSKPETKLSALTDQVKRRDEEDEQKLGDYTYQMSVAQVVKIREIVARLSTQDQTTNTGSVLQVYKETYETFSAILSRGLTNGQTQRAFRSVLESGVNFLLSALCSAEKRQQNLFNEETKKTLMEKIKKTQRLMKRYQSRLPLQICIFLLRFQRRIVSLQRKDFATASLFDWSKKDSVKYVEYCFCGFSAEALESLETLTGVLQIYYEFNAKQKFVVDLLRTETDIARKYAQVKEGTVQFESYFEGILRENEYKAFSSIFYSYLMLFDQIYESCQKFADGTHTINSVESAAHFVQLVTSPSFLELCNRTFYFEDILNMSSPPLRIHQLLKDNLSMRYIELRILIQTYKLVKEYELQTTFQLAHSEKNNIANLNSAIFERFLQESSIEVNSLIYDDEVMLRLIDNLNSQMNQTFYSQLKENLRTQKIKLESFLIQNLNLDQPSNPSNPPVDSILSQMIKRKVNYSMVLRDPTTALSNRFIEAFINRIASKNDELQHEKGSESHVNQRLKFGSKNELWRSEINIDGFVENGLQMLEKYFLAESNTKVNVVALQGGAGLGKTHLCRKLTRTLLKRIQVTGSRKIAIPIMVDMTEVENIEEHGDLEKFLVSSIERYPFRCRAEIAHLKNSTIPKVIILDGLSEWAWGSPCVSIREWIRLREWENTKLIITFRKPFVRAEEYPYFFGQKCKQPASAQEDDERERCFEVFQLLSLSQEGVEEYIRQKEWQISEEVCGSKFPQDEQSSLFESVLQKRPKKEVGRDVRPGFLSNVFRGCTRKNTHLIDMLENPFNLFCFVEILAKVSGLKEIYWGGGGNSEERNQATTWLANQEEMQEKLFMEEINGLITESGVTESMRRHCTTCCVEFFQTLAMSFFTQRKFKASLREIEDLIVTQKQSLVGLQERATFEKVIICVFQNIQRTSFLASSDISFFSFVDKEKPQDEQNQKESSQFLKQLQGEDASVELQLYSFRNTPWLEFFIARAMKYDFDVNGNRLHSLTMSSLQSFAINRRYLLEERSQAEHLPFSISQWTHHASVEMRVLSKLSTIIRKDLLDEDFQLKVGEKTIVNQHRYIQLISRTRRMPSKYNQQQQSMQAEDWVIKHLKHPLDVASSNILSAICFNKLSLSNLKLRNCSFSRAYLYGYRGEMDVACSDLSEANLRASSVQISRSKFMHCLLDDEKRNHERWNSQHAFSYAALKFKDNKTLMCGSNFGGISVFSSLQQTGKTIKKQCDDMQSTMQSRKEALRFWEMTSHQRQFSEEVRAVTTNQGDIYYAFLNVIAHVNEQGEEKELVIGHQNRINDMDVCSRLNLLATGSSDHTVRIWGIQQTSATLQPKAKTDTEGVEVDEDVDYSFAEMDLLHTLTRHTAEVTCVAFSPNGLFLATGSYDETIFIWDVQSKFKISQFLKVHDDWITSLSFSCDSTMIAAGSSLSFIKIWDLTQEVYTQIQEIHRMRLRRNSTTVGEGGPSNKHDTIGGISCLRFSPTNRFLVFATFDEPGIQIYEQMGTKSKEYIRGRVILLDSGHSQGYEFTSKRMAYFLINSVAFSPDGKFLAAASHSQSLCTIWAVEKDQKTQQTHLELEAILSPNRVSALILSTDNRYMASCGGVSADARRVTVWGMTKKGEQAVIIQTLDQGLHQTAVTALSFSPDNGFLASASEDGYIVIWKNFSSLNLTQQQINLPQLRKNSGFLNTTASSLQFDSFKKFQGHQGLITSISFSSDGLCLVSTSPIEKKCKVWSSTSPHFSFDFQHAITWEEEIPLEKLEFSPNGSFLATLPIICTLSSYCQGSVSRTPATLKSVESRSSSRCLIWNAKERFSFFGAVGTVKGREGRSFSTQILTMCFSKDNQLFATGQSNGLCNIWDVSRGFNFMQSIDAHFSALTNVTFSADSEMLATTALDQTCKLWHVPNRFNEISSFYVPPETSAIHFVRQGHSLAVASTSDEFCLKFYDVFSPSYQIDELRAHSGSITQTTFSLDGRFLLTASQDNTCRIWDMKNHFSQHLTLNLNLNQDTNPEQMMGGKKQKKKTSIHLEEFTFGQDENEDIEKSEDTESKLQENQGVFHPVANARDKKRLSFCAAPNIKPSQKYQLTVKEQCKDENIDNVDLAKHYGGILTAAISMQGTFVFVVRSEESRNVLLFDLTQGVDDVRQSVIFNDLTSQITCMTLSVKDEYIAIGCENTEVRIWKRVSLSPLKCEFEPVKTISGRHTKRVSCVAFSSNLQYFASGSWDITCKVFEVNNDFQILHNFDGQYGYIFALCFSPCNEYLAITSRDNSCYVWNISNRLTESEIMDHRQAATAVSYSPYHLATASKDRSFILYDRKSEYKMIRRIENLPESVMSAILSPDGKYLVVGLSNSLVQIWDLFNKYDLTTELISDPMYQQIIEMEKVLNQDPLSEMHKSNISENSLCNFEDTEVPHSSGDSENNKTQENPLNVDKQLPSMKKEIISQIFKTAYPHYQDTNNLEFEIEYTSENHIHIIVPKYPVCIITL